MADAPKGPVRLGAVHHFVDDASVRRDLPPVECKFRYVVCSMQRTGSSLLCRALMDTGLAGQPEEFLHPRMTKAFLERFSRDSIALGDLLTFLEQHRSTANGVFGIKAHLDQVKRAARSDDAVARFISRFEAAILVYRRDKLAQAVSYERAIQTQFWEAEKAEVVAAARRRAIVYSTEAIAKHLTAFIEQEREWRAHLKLSGTRLHIVSYEDLVADFPARMHEIAAFLGDPALGQVAFERPPHQKLSDAVSEEWATRFLADIRGGWTPGQQSAT